MGALYVETVRFSPALVGLYLFAGLLSVFILLQVPGGPGWPLVVLLVVYLLIGACFGKLTVALEADELVVRFGVFGWPSQRIRRSRIVSARSVGYRPIRQFGGWGIRCGTLDGERTSVYSVRGNRGLLLELAEPRRISGFQSRWFLIGMMEPERLESML